MRREAGGRVRTNVLVRDLDLHPINNPDSRRLELVVDGLSLFRGPQLAIDTTLVSPLSRNGTARPRCATVGGAAMECARTRKENRHREVVGDRGRARLVVLARLEAAFPVRLLQFFNTLPLPKSKTHPSFRRADAALVRLWPVNEASMKALRNFEFMQVEK